MAAASATGVIAVRLSGNARSMGAAASRVGRAAPTGIARRASRRVVAAAGADRCVAGKAHAREERVVAVGATPFGFASASLARTFCHRLSRGASFAAAASSGGADAGDNDDDAPVHLTEEEREALDTEAAAMASSWASELSAAAWDDADSAETSDFSTNEKKKTRDKSLRAAVANESYDEDDDDFEENYYDYDADDVEPGYEPLSSSASDADAGDGVDPLTKAKRRRKTRREWGKLPDEKLPRVAIVGRPNVGKSALFNRLTGTKRAIVYDQPGITRDRMYVRAFWGDTEFMMVDTGGLESLPGSPQDAPSVDTVGGVEILPGMVESQAALAVREAAALVFVVDGQRGLTAADEEIYGWIRKFHSKTPLMLAVNKCESTTKGEEQILDFWSLGGVEPLAVSAISGTGTGELMDALVRSLPAPELDEKDAEGRFSEEDDAPLKIAIVGRPNVGKSSLLNQLAGDARAIVSD
jgi:small GTP-binding protein